MTQQQAQRISRIINKIPTLTEGQAFWIERVLKIFDGVFDFQLHGSDILSNEDLINFGDTLRVHHSFSLEPFSKDKFEYVLEQTLKMSGKNAQLANRGNRGHDITINEQTFSLKTQADKNIKYDKIWISKFMELGGGIWGNNPDDLKGLLSCFLAHMNSYDRILTLRTLEKGPQWRYELVEIPKELLAQAQNGRLEMKLDSKQLPKPGYCHVLINGQLAFQLYFDGGGERKLQVKNLLKEYCNVHASWAFTIPE